MILAGREGVSPELEIEGEGEVWMNFLGNAEDESIYFLQAGVMVAPPRPPPQKPP